MPDASPPPLMHPAGVLIEDQFAEAFRMWACRVIVTATDEHWVNVAAGEVTGYGSSVIGCDAEAAVERYLTPDETPDARPGAALLFFAFNAKGLTKAVPNRVGQCLMTCPTTAVFDGMPQRGLDKNNDAEARIDLGKQIRFFGDGFQKSKLLAGRRYWRIPVMDGEFMLEESVGACKAIGGGNLLIEGIRQRDALTAAQRAVEAIAPMPDVITPFPGGIVRSGSKVGSRYKALFASSNDAYAPTVRQRTKTELRNGAGAVYEIVINGLTEAAIASAMQTGIDAACASPNIIAISAGNYGGNLGKFHFHLRDLVQAETSEAQPETKPPSASPAATAVSSAAASQPIATTADAPAEVILTWKPRTGPAPIDGSSLRPDTLATLPLDQLAATPFRIGKRTHRLGDLFDIAGSPSAESPRLRLRNPPVLDRLGAQMTTGLLTIEGHAGDALGASMRGGRIVVLGDAGERAGGPDHTRDRGMTGGELVIAGKAGRYLGMQMRRGVIVAGEADTFAGFRMLAGTIAVLRGVVDRPGLEMRRGSILALGDPAPKPFTAMAAEGVFYSEELPALRLMLKHIDMLAKLTESQAEAQPETQSEAQPSTETLDRPALTLPPFAWTSRYRLSSGDVHEMKRGELWERLNEPHVAN